MNSAFEIERVRRMARLGAHVLSFWFLVSSLPGLGSLAWILLGKHAPALRMLFESQAIEGLDARALAAIDGVALLANTLIVVYCASSLFIIRRCLLRRDRGSFLVLAGGALGVQ